MNMTRNQYEAAIVAVVNAMMQETPRARNSAAGQRRHATRVAHCWKLADACRKEHGQWPHCWQPQKVRVKPSKKAGLYVVWSYHDGSCHGLGKLLPKAAAIEAAQQLVVDRLAAGERVELEVID